MAWLPPFRASNPLPAVERELIRCVELGAVHLLSPTSFSRSPHSVFPPWQRTGFPSRGFQRLACSREAALLPRNEFGAYNSLPKKPWFLQRGLQLRLMLVGNDPN